MSGITIKTKEEVDALREGGKNLAHVLKELAKVVKPGVTKLELDYLAEKLIIEGGDEPAFKNYRPDGAKIAFPATLCVSANDDVVHGIPTSEPLKEGDIVGLDLGLKHKGLFTDAAITVGVGKVGRDAQKLMEVTRKSLEVGIKAARAGSYTGDIGYAIESYVNKFGYGIVRDLSGHGVGYKIHEPPYVPNFGEQGDGVLLRPGMVLALEPMINIGGDEIVLGKDNFTYRTRDRSLSAHFEKTIVITHGAAEVLTPW
ncbi:MAG: type I methionyl aminopeptidase [Candidatus Paceibacterota bacterium]|jgi:methionyl aminopeptidase